MKKKFLKKNIIDQYRKQRNKILKMKIYKLVEKELLLNQKKSNQKMKFNKQNKQILTKMKKQIFGQNYKSL